MRRITPTTAAGLLLLLAGCATVAPVSTPGTSAGAHAQGKATRLFPYPCDAVRSAIPAALGDLKIHAVRPSADAGTSFYEAATADSRPVWVTLRPDRGAARVSVRVGWFGDPPLSTAVLDRVGVRLGALPPAAIPAEPPSAPGPNPFFSRSAVSDAEMLREQADARYRDSMSWP